jgi:Zn-dependent protease with chaperone function
LRYPLCFAAGPVAFAQQKTDLSASQMPSVIAVPPEARPSDHFNVEAATNAYLAQIPATARARSDAYFEGGYWLMLWDFLLSVVIYWALLQFGWSVRMCNLAERLTRFRPLQTFLYWLQFILITSVLEFPLGVYEGYFREWKYGLATQAFGPWMVDQLKGLLISIVLGGLVAMALVGIVRRLPNTWHIWGTIITMAFAVFGIMIGPVVLQPMFNKVTRLDDPKITQPILSMARANGIPATDVYQIDASRQTTRMSANVSGFGKTMRITLNDNLLRRGSPEEIQEAMGHENRVRITPLDAGLVPQALGRALANSWHNRRRGYSSGLFAGLFLLCAHSDTQYADAYRGTRSRHVRFECQPAAGWRRAGRHSPRRISQDESGPAGRVDFLRSPEWPHADSQCHALEGGKSPALPALGNSLGFLLTSNSL